MTRVETFFSASGLKSLESDPRVCFARSGTRTGTR